MVGGGGNKQASVPSVHTTIARGANITHGFTTGSSSDEGLPSLCGTLTS